MADRPGTPAAPLRDYAITTLAELETAITAAIGEAILAGWERRATPELRKSLTRRLLADAGEVISAEADRIARPPYRTRRERERQRRESAG